MTPFEIDKTAAQLVTTRHKDHFHQPFRVPAENIKCLLYFYATTARFIVSDSYLVT